MTLRFGDFELDAERYELRENGVSRAVEPKVFDLIAHLAGHPDQVFSRDELVARVWRGRVVSDATVSTCIKSARKALGDSGAAQAYIRTVRGRGFRFAVPVERSDAADGRAATGGGAARASTSRPPGAERDPALLVLPLRAIGAGEDALALASTLTADLQTILTRIPLLRISTAAARVSSAAAVAPTAREIHEQTGVDYVLEGTTQQAGDAYRITVQLADARSGFGLWGERFSVPGPLATAQERALIAVVARLEPQLSRAIYDTVRANRDEPTARSLFHEASGILALKGWHHRSFAEAAQILQRSRALDEGFALAPAYLSLVLGLGHRVGLVMDRDRARAEALEAAESAMELDPMDSTVLGYAGCALADIGQAERAEPILRNAVEIRPANAQAWAALGSVCLLRGELEQAVAHLSHGIDISPLDSRLCVWGALLALAHLLSGDGESALAQARLACQRDDRNYLPRVVLAAVLLSAGDTAHAARALGDARRVKPDLARDEMVYAVGHTLGEPLARLQPAPASGD